MYVVVCILSLISHQLLLIYCQENSFSRKDDRQRRNYSQNEEGFNKYRKKNEDKQLRVPTSFKKDLELESAKRTIQILRTTLVFTEFNLKMKEEILKTKEENGKGSENTQSSKNEVPSSKRKCHEAEKLNSEIEVITID